MVYFRGIPLLCFDFLRLGVTLGSKKDNSSYHLSLRCFPFLIPLWLFRALFFLFCFLKILFIHERHRERKGGRDTGRGRSRLAYRDLTWDSIPGLQD